MVICDFRQDTLDIRYSYGKKPLITGTLSVGYSYSSRVYDDITDPFVGFKAAATQSVANNLPPWMEMRKSEDSHGWKLMNSYGMSYEGLVGLMDYHMRNMFLATSDRWQRFRYYRGELSVNELFDFPTSRNLLTNSSFSQPDLSRLRLPSQWTDYNKPTTQAIFLDSTTALRGTYSARMEGAVTLSQLVNIAALGPVTDFTASVYVKSSAEVDLSLVLSVQGIDTSIKSSETRFTDTPQGWQRITVSLPFNEEAFAAQIVLRSNTVATLYLDCVQLEVASIASDWQASDLDKLLYVDSAIPLRFVEARSNTDSITVFPIGNIPDFSGVLIPTRLSPAQPKPVALEPFNTTTLGRRVTFFDNSFSVDWDIKDEKIAATDSKNEFEVFERYDIRDLTFFQGLGYGTIDDPKATIVPLASAIRDDLLFVVAKETFRGRTIRTLKVLTPRKPPTGQTYLESFVDFELDLKFDTTYGPDALVEEVSSIGFSEGDPSWMVVDTTIGRRFYFHLYYDYYYADLATRAIYTLERYDNAQLQVA